MSGSQSGIRQLHDQVSALEAAAARPKRRRLLPHAAVLVAAIAIGAASAGIAHHDTVLHRAPALVAVPAPVAHLIDAPSDRARALPVVQRHRSHHRARVAVVVHHTTPAPVTHVLAPVVAVPTVTERAIAHRPAAPVQHTAPARTHARSHTNPKPQTNPEPHTNPKPDTNPTPKPAATAAPVGHGAVVVTTSEEPQPDADQPDADGSSPTTAP